MDSSAAGKRLISLLLPDLGMGGAERVFLTLADSFAQRGYQVHLVVTRAEGALVHQVPQGVVLMDLAAGSESGSLFKLVRYLRKYRPYALLSTLDLMSSIAILARWLAGVKTLILVREANTPSQMPRAGWKKVVERLLLRWLFPRANILVAVSHGVADDMRYYASIDSRRITVIYNPALPDDLDVLKLEQVEHPWFAPGQPPIIMGMGSLVDRKNFPLLIRAFDQISSQCDARLVIFGEGEQRSALQMSIYRLNLADRIILPGQALAPFAYMARASVFVLSSNLEGLPNVLIQALASGCPVVSTDCPSGPREILDDGRFGKLVPVGDADAMAKAILGVLAGDHPMVDTAWLDQFRIGRVVDQYLAVLGLSDQEGLPRK
ncbi:MAG: glycosyltransferase [Anaerolineae bacterium]|nr:glycosyltransferase [Anaerolineae bacterium]